MFGVLLTLLAVLFVTLLGVAGFRRWLSDLDPAAQIGLGGLLGLGCLGLITFLVGLATLTPWLPFLILTAVLAALCFRKPDTLQSLKGFLKASRPQSLDLLFPLVIAVGLFMSLAGVLAPSTPNDWDSIAYHLAVPKMWLEQGKIDVISYIHQSNFPFTVDSLFLLGLKWGGQAGAKMFVWCYSLLGIIAIFGLARQRYGQRAGWWASLAFASVPIVLWQSGTAYIDVAHGLYAGLGLLFACWWLESDDSKYAWLSGVLLGFAAGSKYTGLQTIAVAGLIALVGAILLKRNLKPVFVIGLIALVVGAPWYIKNAVWKENPVFPFFYSKLGGKDWDQRRAEIYTIEQNTFGVGREKPPEGGLQPMRLGHSILGLAYQPGRYVNPRQTVGGGDPMGAIGMAIVGALMLGLLAGYRDRFERTILIAVLLNLLIWFVLTQQSRYIVTLAVPLAVLAGGLTNRRGFAPLMMGMVGVQALISLYLLNGLRFSDQMQVVTGKVTPEEFQARRIGFYNPAQVINQLGKQSKVALYDEVFGYLLDVPYYWANPGHSTEIPYDSMQSGKDYAEAMKKMGFTHIYMDLSTKYSPLEPGAERPMLAELMLASFSGQPFPEPYRERFMGNWEAKFNVLVPEAVAQGALEVVQAFGRPESPRSILLKLR